MLLLQLLLLFPTPLMYVNQQRMDEFIGKRLMHAHSYCGLLLECLAKILLLPLRQCLWDY
ncbi:hypothetical protein KXD40_005010 [Peronospora effusa]|nr:hypothetical protein KXD40_005010 [Peronospora effusa]